MSAPVSGYCGGGWHHLCFGNVQREDGMWVYCSCPESSCVCHQRPEPAAGQQVGESA